MNYINKLLSSALCLSLAVMTASCSMSDDMECPPDGSQQGGGKAYIQLSFSMAGAQGTRANPNGGEDGDGEEQGQQSENEIETAVAFLFAGNVTVNGSASTPVTPVYFSKVTPDGQEQYVTETKQADVDTGEYNLIVVANPGDDHWWETVSPLYLGDVRDHIQKTAWKATTNDHRLPHVVCRRTYTDAQT